MRDRIAAARHDLEAATSADLASDADDSPDERDAEQEPDDV
jgi:hypothetical protein